MMNFTTIDVETANADRASICQIGIVHVVNSEIVDQWKTLVNPKDWFDDFIVSIHGIHEADVRHSPIMPQIVDELRRRLQDSVLVSHSTFDKTALERSLNKYKLEQLQAHWLDSTRMVRRAWPERYAKRGYGLAKVANDLDISFEHHDALEDARAVAEIVLRVCHETDTDIEYWLNRVNQPIPRQSSPSLNRGSVATSTSTSARRQPNQHGPLFEECEVYLFTGALESMTRTQAADVAAYAGCRVVNGATAEVTRLIVGAENRSALNGYDKSSKHRSIETRVSKGASIEICSEEDWIGVLKTAFEKEEVEQQINEVEKQMAPLKAQIESAGRWLRIDSRARYSLHAAFRNLRKGWCKGALARDETNQPVEKRSHTARSWSLDGALLSGDHSRKPMVK